MGIGVTELLIALAILLLIFGHDRIPKLAKGLGESVSEFRKGMNKTEEMTEEQVNSSTDPGHSESEQSASDESVKTPSTSKNSSSDREE